MDEPFVGLPGRVNQWVFDKRVIVGRGASHLSLVSSAADGLDGRPNDAIIIRPGIWREMSEFSADCVLLVLASETYDESDYIRDYQTFKNFVAKAGRNVAQFLRRFGDGSLQLLFVLILC